MSKSKRKDRGEAASKQKLQSKQASRQVFLGRNPTVFGRNLNSKRSNPATQGSKVSELRCRSSLRCRPKLFRSASSAARLPNTHHQYIRLLRLIVFWQICFLRDPLAALVQPTCNQHATNMQPHATTCNHMQPTCNQHATLAPSFIANFWGPRCVLHTKTGASFLLGIDRISRSRTAVPREDLRICPQH
jgi:hypothetical protein